jgi:hypothetical protein
VTPATEGCGHHGHTCAGERRAESGGGAPELPMSPRSQESVNRKLLRVHQLDDALPHACALTAFDIVTSWQVASNQGKNDDGKGTAE